MKTIAYRESAGVLGRQAGFNFQETVLQFSKYFVVGGVAALTEWSSYWALVYFLRWNYMVAAVIAFVVATGVNYVLCIRFVFFQHRFSRESEIKVVYIVSIVGAIINLSALAILVEWGDVNVYIAKIMATGIAFSWNFFSRWRWVFVEKDNLEEAKSGKIDGT